MQKVVDFLSNIKTIAAILLAAAGFLMTLRENPGPMPGRTLTLAVKQGWSWCGIKGETGYSFRKDGECVAIEKLMKGNFGPSHQLMVGDVIELAIDKNENIARLVYKPCNKGCRFLTIIRTKVYFWGLSKYIPIEGTDKHCLKEAEGRKKPLKPDTLNTDTLAFRMVVGYSLPEIIRNATPKQEEVITRILMKETKGNVFGADRISSVFSQEGRLRLFVYRWHGMPRPRIFAIYKGKGDSWEHEAFFILPKKMVLN